ncbi:MAG: hypothetical protein COU35_03310 [Candidatus Magasanikbacteria bacterium CG10_big_fil_rev_8_21_14_0_10_47_10]|uniref:Dephospho-CoA kinase n=1 Tax=Candidatus Magasanikbacteria bacterium CG10_big_fil_rev_8_21_14_0_10_47_10 TaxID=1974652 RepID=A0A2H0TQ72_9BACT|nr:MAG: hypothetical protein COU35_03310 [Candidatus Magasanikbacteria bacterium CG10_big_fil_rev_8_21_14_0_10_47_10]
MKIVIGLVGQLASGKGTAAAYLKEKHGASTYRFSSILRDIADRLYLDQSRGNLQLISQVLRQNIREDLLSEVIAKDAMNDPHELVVIDGVRRPDDVKHLRTIPGFILVHITADAEKRYDRLIKRGENTDDTQKTFEQFKADHAREAELKINEIATQANDTLDNNGSLEELHKQLDKLIQKYAHTNQTTPS